jgi:hypothetical protein
MLPTIVLAAALCAQPPCDFRQLPRSFDRYDDKVLRQGYETRLDKERREYQERWPQMQHCRLPTCSTR